jgi:hypothetical protein
MCNESVENHIRFIMYKENNPSVSYADSSLCTREPKELFCRAISRGETQRVTEGSSSSQKTEKINFPTYKNWLGRF